MSAFKPAKVLKGQVAQGSRNASLRSVLVVFQFTTSIILIIGTVVIFRQMQFILHKKVGFNKDQVMMIQGTNTLSDIQAFKNDLQLIPQVQSVSISDYLPVMIPDAKYNGNSFYVYSKRKETPPIFGQFWIVDQDYVPTMGMTLLEGRNFSKAMASDTGAAIINEAMVKKLGLGPHPVGAVITNFGAPLTVIGVVQDFNYWSFRDEIRPLCLFLGISPSVVSIRVKSAQMGDLVPRVTAVWKKYLPNQSLRYSFMDESFRHMYADVDRAGTILTCFTVLAIIIACLGLFALSSFMAEQRTKEVGIRKVLGASMGNLVFLLSRDFVRLIVISVLIASPVAWWAMHAWLQDFTYRQEITWWIFIVVAGVALAIALLTTGFQSMRTALNNPVKSLKSE
jgi:putative ABC transport system permease protein